MQERYAPTRRANIRKRRRTDPQFKVRTKLSSRITHVLRLALKKSQAGQKLKKASTMKLTGCSIEYLMKHLEKQFDSKIEGIKEFSSSPLDTKLAICSENNTE